MTDNNICTYCQTRLIVFEMPARGIRDPQLRQSKSILRCPNKKFALDRHTQLDEVVMISRKKTHGSTTQG